MSASQESRDYAFAIRSSRLDTDPNLIEGSACVVRLELVPSTELRNAPQIEYSTADVNAGGIEEPELMLTIGIGFLRSLVAVFLRNGRACRLEGSELADRSWLESFRCDFLADLPGCMERLAAMTRSSGSDAYPILIWVMPVDFTWQIDAAIAEFRGMRTSWSLWRQIIDSGVLRLTVSESTCSVAFSCEQFDQCRRWIEEAVEHSSLPARWQR